MIVPKILLNGVLLFGTPLVNEGAPPRHAPSPGAQPGRPISRSADEFTIGEPLERLGKFQFHCTRSNSTPVRMVCLPWVQETWSAHWNWFTYSVWSSKLLPPSRNKPPSVNVDRPGTAATSGVIPNCVLVKECPGVSSVTFL